MRIQIPVVKLNVREAFKNKGLYFIPYILLVLVWVLFPKKTGIFPLDDAYIHLTYARNLARTGTLCFNPGEPSIGTSSLLWTVILAPVSLLTNDPYWAVQILSLSLFGFLCFLVIDTVRTSAIRLRFSEKEAKTCSFLAGTLLALNGNLHWFSLSGMETMLFLCLCFLSIKVYSRRDFDFVTGGLSGLVFLTRAPGGLLGFTFVLFDLLRRKGSSVYKGIIAMFLVIVPYFCLSVHITGSWFPTTARGKLSTYVDGGLNWERIAKIDFWHNDLTQNLLKNNIIKNDENDPDYCYFTESIKNTEQLKENLQRIGIVDSETKTILRIWGRSRKNRVYWYWKILLLYQKYLPHNYSLLVAFIIMIFVVIHKYRDSWNDFSNIVLSEQLECSVMGVWGFLHLMLYSLSFRTFLHHTRYLANEYVIGTIIGSISILILMRRKSREGGVFLAIISVVLAASTLFYWREVYANNIRQVDQVYVQMGKWIKKNTPPDAKIAAFDIGVLRYVGDRYAVDLGGLVDPEVHPYLEKRECGEYIRQKGADYLLYSRNIEVDFFTGIFLAEYRGEMLLKQIPLVYFETSQYEAPTLTHSYRMDLNRIIGWYPRTSDGLLQAFSYDNRPYQPIGQMIDNRLELVGYSIDQREIELIPHYPYAVNFTFFYKARNPLQHLYWVHLALFNPGSNTIFDLFDHIPTHNLLPYNRWPLNQIIQEHHIYFFPADTPHGKFQIKLAITSEEFLNKNHPEKYSWFGLGSFVNKGNRLFPMDHLQRAVNY